MEPSANGTGQTVIDFKPVIFNFPGGKKMEVEILDTQLELQGIFDDLTKAAQKAAEGKFDENGIPVKPAVMRHEYYKAIIAHYKDKCGIEMSMNAADQFVFEISRLEAETKKKQHDFFKGMQELQTSTASTPSDVDD